MSDLPAETIDPPQREEDATPFDAIEQIVREHYGLSGHAKTIGNASSTYVIDNGHMRYRLDIRSADKRSELELDTAILQHLGQKADAPDVPEPVSSRDGLDVVALAQEGGDVIRVLTMLDGTPLPTSHMPDPAEIAGIGRLAAELARSLADFDDPGLDRPLDSDLRQAGPVVLRLLSGVTDHAVRDPIAKVLVTALRRVQPLGPTLRIQPVHHELTIDGMVGRQGEDGGWRAQGIVDVDGVLRGWLVGSLAVTCADIIGRGNGDPFDILPAVQAFHETYPLLEPELLALWPLIVARASVLAAEAESNAISAGEQADEIPEHVGRKVFGIATGVHPALMEAAILDAAGSESDSGAALSDDICRLLPEIDEDQIRLVDLGIGSPLLVDGNWTDPEIDWRMLARAAWETHMGATRYGEYRLSRSVGRTGAEMDNYALHVDICVPAGSVVVAPFGGMLKEVGQQLVLVGRDAVLYLEGLVCPLSEGMALFAEDAIGSVAGAEGSVGGLRIRLCREPDLVPPLFTTPARAGAWKRLCPSPSQLLGIDVDAPVPRAAEFVRGWRAHVYDGIGRAMVDLSGAAGIVGHGHPALAEAAYRQWSQLASLPQDGGISIAERSFRDRILMTLPQELGTIAAIGSEQEIVALARTLLDRNEDQANLFEAEIDETAGTRARIRIADETQTGLGRAGHGFWQFENDETPPDAVVIGSILHGKPLALLVVRNDLGEPTIGHPCLPTDPVDCAVAAAALTALRDDGLQDNARLIGDRLRAALDSAISAHGGMSIDGNGLAIELHFDEPVAHTVARSLFNRGFLTAPVMDPARLELRPPLCLDNATAESLALALSEILEASKNATVIGDEEIQSVDLLSDDSALPI